MVLIDLQNFTIINNLIERDSKDATYKYALIRGSIEVFQNYDHYKEENDFEISFPLGLLIERWFLYYYPIFESGIFIPQMGADTRYHNGKCEKPQFRAAFDPVIEYYHKNGNGFSHAYSAYRNGCISPEIRESFLTMLLQIRDTLVDMPMYHLGHSIKERNNEIFRAEKRKPHNAIKFQIDPGFLVKHYGKFFIKREYYEAFKNAGPFLIGDNSILFRWAQFSERKIEEKSIRFGEILRTIADYPVEERDIQDSKQFFQYLTKKDLTLRSVWSNTVIHSADDRNWDHVIPFSISKNNDLWNILPSLKSENADKSDKIPDPALLQFQKNIIIEYWTEMMEYKPELFTKQIRYSLIGDNYDSAHWQEQAFTSLERKCRHMIEELGYASWKNQDN